MNEPYSYRDYYLEHYGVKGMHWGVRKKITASVNSARTKHKAKVEIKNAWTPDNHNKSYSQSQIIDDKSYFGKPGVARINKRMNSGDTYSKAATKEIGRKFVTDMAIRTATVAVVSGGLNAKLNPDVQAQIMKGASFAGKAFFGDRKAAAERGLGYAKAAKYAKGAYRVTSMR